MSLFAPVLAVPGEDVNTYPANRQNIDETKNDLKSPVVQKLVKESAIELYAKDPEKAKQAVDVFHDIRMPTILVDALKRPGYWFKLHVAKALTSLAGKEVVKLPVSSISDALKDDLGLLVSGGSEIDIQRRKYRRELVRCLEIASGDKCVDPENVEGLFLWLERISEDEKHRAEGRNVEN
jgi:hypothetical protein